MADGFSTEQSKRLFGFIGVGGTLGAIAGGATTVALVEAVGPFGVLLVSAALLEVASQCVRRLVRIFGIAPGAAVRPPAGKCPNCEYDLSGLVITPDTRCPECGKRVMLHTRTPEPGPGVLAGIHLITRSPYLLLICIYLFLYTTLSTFLYLQQARVVELAIPDREARTVLFAQIDMAVNVLTLLTQLFLTGRIIKGIGVGPTLAILPAVSIIGFAALWATPALGLPLLGTFVAFQIARRGLHYAVSRPTREILFTVLGQDEKYKSKPFIDTFVYRGGDLFGAWSPNAIIAAAARQGIAAISAIPMAAIPLAAISLGVGLVLGRMQRRKVKALHDQARGEITEAMRPVIP
jgi:ATP:ADP antiporter, AAA family